MVDIRQPILVLKYRHKEKLFIFGWVQCLPEWIGDDVMVQCTVYSDCGDGGVLFKDDGSRKIKLIEKG